MQDTPLLNRIGSLEDYKQLPQKDLEELAREIRLCLVNVVSQNGGHLASNLGAVELTMALDRVFDSPKDKLIFDVAIKRMYISCLQGVTRIFLPCERPMGWPGFPNGRKAYTTPLIQAMPAPPFLPPWVCYGPCSYGGIPSIARWP